MFSQFRDLMIKWNIKFWFADKQSGILEYGPCTLKPPDAQLNKPYEIKQQQYRYTIQSHLNYDCFTQHIWHHKPGGLKGCF